MIRGTLLSIMLVCCALLKAPGPVPRPRPRAAPTAPVAPNAPPAPPAPQAPQAPAAVVAGFDDLLAALVEEAKNARADRLLPEGKPDLAARLGRAVPPDELLPALLTRRHADPFIDAYVRWQLTSFDPDLPDLDDHAFIRVMNEAPAMVENPAAAEDVLAVFAQARDAKTVSPDDAGKLREAWTEIQRRAAVAQSMNRPAVAWRDWVESRLPTTGARPRQWRLERCAATIRAGWPPRTIKGRITRDFKASRVDAAFTPDRRRLVAGQISDLEGLKRRFVREVSIRPDGTVHVGFSTAAITGHDVERWTSILVGESP
ncbi:MAG: hypothetical protein ACYTGG_04730 [Planctomycetota bacterium]